MSESCFYELEQWQNFNLKICFFLLFKKILSLFLFIDQKLVPKIQFKSFLLWSWRHEINQIGLFCHLFERVKLCLKEFKV